MADTWRPGFFDQSPMLAPFECGGTSLAQMDSWPDLTKYNDVLPKYPDTITTGCGKPIRFVSQDRKPKGMEDTYEGRVYLTGEVQTRTENWHDFFNALVWLAFPRSKSALNARHFESLAADFASAKRGQSRDALTLFDESGVAVIYSDDELAQLLRGHQWKELFWTRRREVREKMKFVVFGHSLHEKALNPYIGLTGKGLLLKVDADFLGLPQVEQEQRLDHMIAARFAGGSPQLCSREFVPVPLLGVPGWWPDNEDAAFYDNTGYFRPLRGKSRSGK